MDLWVVMAAVKVFWEFLFVSLLIVLNYMHAFMYAILSCIIVLAKIAIVAIGPTVYSRVNFCIIFANNK